MSKANMVLDFINEHCSVIGTPRKEELKKLVKDTIGDLEDRIEELEEDVESSEEEVAELTTGVVFRLEGEHANLRNVMVIESLQENFEDIPIVELENFIEQYKKK